MIIKHLCHFRFSTEWGGSEFHSETVVMVANAGGCNVSVTVHCWSVLN